MAVGVLTAAPEFTKQIYDDVTEKMFGHASPMREDEAPEGLIVHSAGQGEQGYYVYDIWESREAFERFMEDKLGPALGEVMGGPKRGTAVLPDRRAGRPALRRLGDRARSPCIAPRTSPYGGPQWQRQPCHGPGLMSARRAHDRRDGLAWRAEQARRLLAPTQGGP